VVQQLRSVGPASVPGLLYDLGEYPGAIVDPQSDSRIIGHAFELPASESLIAALDRYEGFDPANRSGSLFIREKREALMSDGQLLSCWIYVYQRNISAALLIPDGDYSRHRPIH
jgi:gamma-glutamylcyclotransferase (GGCT)/AIG2-like uncharacterized protein YtfP